MTTRYLIVPYADGESEPRVLMARVQMLQKRASGRNIRGQIPDHAGQLTLIDGEAPDATAADTAAFGIIRTYTGIDLSNPATRAIYGMSSPRFEPLKDANYTPFIAVYLESDRGGLENLARAIQSNLLSPAGIDDGTYAAVEAMHASQAQLRVGAIPPPQDGWANFIKRTYYVTQGPGALDVTYPTLVTQIAQRSRMSGDVYALAIGKISGGAQPQPQPKTGRILRFEVEHAEAVGGIERTYAANYNPAGTVVIRAVVEPAEAAQDLAWTNGLPDPEGRGDRRCLSLSEITPYGSPTRISATLGKQTMGVAIIVRPLLERFEVRNAERVPDFGPSGGEWIAEYSEDEPPIEIEITTRPNSREAHAHLQWTGGEADREHRSNVRVVPRNRLTEPEGAKLRVAVNPWWDFVLHVFPGLRQVALVPAAGIYPPVGNVHCVDFNLAGTYQIRVTTRPDIALAHRVLSWTADADPNPIAAGTATLTRNRHPMNLHNAHVRYTVAVRAGGRTFRSLAIDVRVQPVLQSLTFSGMVFNDGAGPGLVHWHSYAVAGLFGLPNPLSVTVTARTNPSNRDAWLHLTGWQDTDAPGINEAQRIINLNPMPNPHDVRNLQVGVRVGPAPLRIEPLVITNAQAWPMGDPQLSVDSIIFRGPGQQRVRHDEIGHVGQKFDRTWRHAIPAIRQPVAYTRDTVGQPSSVSINPTVTVTAAPVAPMQVDIRATAFLPRHNQPLYRMEWRWNANAVPAMAPPALVLATQAANVRLPSEVVFAPNMPIFWEMHVGGGWILFDVTSHPFFVTLGAPVRYQMTDVDAVVDARLYYTLLARSCEQAHGDHTEAAFITHVFAAFRALAPGNGDNPMFARKLVPLNPRLTYWLPDDDPGQSLRDMFRGNTADSRHSGSCKAWAEAFICMAAMHGINALRNVLVTPNRALANTATSFLVNTFTFTPAPAPSGTAYTHDWTAGPAAPGEATWGPGVVGQNNQTPPPCFENHFIVIDQNGVYYDPSYGSGPHATWQAWKTAAIAGLRDRRVSPDSGYKATLAIPKVVALEDAVTSAPLN